MATIFGESGESNPIPDADVPATFINRFQIRVGPQVTRLTFGEAVVGVEAKYHTAIVMLTSDASELSTVIQKLIEQNQKLSQRS